MCVSKVRRKSRILVFPSTFLNVGNTFCPVSLMYWMLDIAGNINSCFNLIYIDRSYVVTRSLQGLNGLLITCTK